MPSSKMELHEVASEVDPKHVLLIGGGFNLENCDYWYDTPHRLGYVLSVADNSGHFAEGLASSSYVKNFFHVNLQASEEELADQLTHILMHRGIKFDGVFTFKDCFLVPAAIAATRANLPTIGVEVYRTIRRKDCVRNAIRCSIPRYRILGRDDLSAAAEVVGFPAILKPESGEGSLAVKRVETLTEAHVQYEKLLQFVQSGASGLNKTQHFLMEKFIAGSEYDVDIIMQNGELLFASVQDEHETVAPWFREAGGTVPSKLPVEEQIILSNFAAQVCRKLGATDGVFSIEAIVSESKPYLIEMNGRPGGLLIKHGIEAAWGVDIIEAAFKIAVGDTVSNLPNRGILDGFLSGVVSVTKYPTAPITGYINGDVSSVVAALPNVAKVMKMVTEGMRILGPEEVAPWWMVYVMFVMTGDPKEAEAIANKHMDGIDLRQFIIAEIP